MSHPESVDIFQASGTTQPCFTESLERMPTHAFLIQPHLDEAWREPAIFQLVVKMWCTVCCLKQQSRFSGCICILSQDVAGTLQHPGAGRFLSLRHRS